MRRLALVLSLAAVLGGCAPAPPPQVGDDVGDGDVAAEAAAGTDATARPYALEFLLAYENVRSAPYYPLEGLAGICWYGDGSLYICDEKAGRVHGYSPADDLWFQFDSPGSRFFRPVDVRIDHFKVLVLDMDGRSLLRYDLGGAYQDQMVNFTHLDPGYDRLPSSFDVDLDGRLVFTDVSESQALLLDSFLAIQTTVGGPGSHREQFQEPSGVAFLNDGSFVVADRANRRLQRFSRLGYLEQIVGGEFDRHNVLLTPQGLDTDPDGNLFVADPAGRAVHVYAPDLTLLFSAGPSLGLLASPQLPIDVAVGPDDLLAVADRDRQAVLIYRILYR
jgi:sugar lactone lactonase YvrE